MLRQRTILEAGLTSVVGAILQGSMRKEITSALIDEAKRLDEIYFQLGDVLDVKASIILVIATFLGTISAQVLALDKLSWLVKLLQLGTVISVGSSLILTVLALRIREFDAPPDPKEWRSNVDQWEKYYSEYPNGEDWLVSYFEEYRMKLFIERIDENKRLAAEKSKLNKWALRFVASALLLEFATLVLLALNAYHIQLRALLHL